MGSNSTYALIEDIVKAFIGDDVGGFGAGICLSLDEKGKREEENKAKRGSHVYLYELNMRNEE